MGAHHLLFVAGVGRSGTTALTEVLAAHPLIALGIERYKRRWAPEGIGTLTSEMFERDRFFDFSDGLTNIVPELGVKWAEHYRRMADKWDDAVYVGDKMTALRMQLLWKIHPDARFVCIVRDIESVAHSWGVRAANPGDRWNAKLDAQASVAVWNRGLEKVRTARRRRPDQVAVVEYTRFFGDPEATSLKAVLSQLGLEYDERVAAAFSGAHTSYIEHIQTKERPLSDTDRAFIDGHADLKLWRSLERLTV